jgi:hypothetical protein
MIRMRPHRMLAAIGLLTCATIWAQPRPSAEGQSRTLDIARANVLHHGQSLPDFLCTEVVQRSWMPDLARQAGDKLTIQLTYFGQKEKYKLLTVDGAPTSRPFESLEGLVSGGEFGTMLFRAFDPASAAEFHWKGWTTIAKRRAGLYAYRVEHAHSHHTLGYDTASGELRTITVAHQGVVALDSETSMVLRLTLEAADIPPGFPILKAANSMEYGFIDISGRSYLLPVRRIGDYAAVWRHTLRQGRPSLTHASRSASSGEPQRSVVRGLSQVRRGLDHRIRSRQQEEVELTASSRSTTPRRLWPLKRCCTTSGGRRARTS